MMKCTPPKHFLRLSLFISFSLFFVLSCKTKDVSKTKEESSIKNTKKLVEQRLYNEDKTMLLILSYEEKLESVKNINFKVIEVATNKQILSDVFNGMKLEWNDNTSLKGYLSIGMIEQENGNPDEVTNNTNQIKIIKIKN